MNYTDIIIEESLDDTSLLSNLKVLNTEVEVVNENFKTPWLKQWTLHTVEIPDTEITSITEKLSHSFDKEHPDWYADFKNDESHYIIFPNKVFNVRRSDPENYRPAVKHGLSLGIPIYQLNFVPEIEQWKF